MPVLASANPPGLRLYRLNLPQPVRSVNLPFVWRRYHLASEFKEALEHAADRGTNSKALLRMDEGTPADPESVE